MTGRWRVASIVLLAVASSIGLGTRLGDLRLSWSPPSLPEVQPVEWREVPPSPLAERAGHAAVWTGEQFIVWGGFSVRSASGSGGGVSLDTVPAEHAEVDVVGFADGASFDSRNRRWERIADAPFTAGYTTRAAWTGDEIIVLTVDMSSFDLHMGGYDPDRNRWRRIATPVGRGAVLEAVWTGRELLVWGTYDHEAGRGQIGFAYDPVRDGWRELPDAPVPARQWHTVVWSGSEMIVWGGSDLVGPPDENLGGAAFDPRNGRWRRVADAPIAFRYGHSAVWTGREMIIWGGKHLAALSDGAAYDPVRDTWRRIEAAPISGRIDHASAWYGGAVIVWGGTAPPAGAPLSDGAAYDPNLDRWTLLPSSPAHARCRATATATPGGMLLWGGTPDCGGTSPRPVAAPGTGAQLVGSRNPPVDRDGLTDR